MHDVCSTGGCNRHRDKQNQRNHHVKVASVEEKFTCQILDDIINNKKGLLFNREEGADREQKYVRTKPNFFFTVLNTKLHQILQERFAYLLRGKNSTLS